MHSDNAENNKKNNIWLLVITIMFIALYIYRCFGISFWYDEAYGIVYYARVPFVEIIPNAVMEASMPPLHYYVLWMVAAAFGQNAFSYHFTSLIPVMILFVWNYFEVRKRFGNNVAYMFALMLGIGMPFYEYTTEVRAYSWSMLFVLLCGYHVWLMMIQEHITVKDMVLLIIGGVGAAYSHYFAFAAVGIIYLIAYVWVIAKKYNNSIRFVVASSVFSLLCYAPWLLIFISHIQTVTDDLPTEGMSFPSITGALVQPFGTRGVFFWMIFIAAFVYSIYKKEKENVYIVSVALGTYWLVYLLCGFYNVYSRSAAFKAKYLTPIEGLLLFSFAFLIARTLQQKKIFYVISILLMCVFFLPHYYDILADEKDCNLRTEASLELLEQYPPEDTFIVKDGDDYGNVMLKMYCDDYDSGVVNEESGDKKYKLYITSSHEPAKSDADYLGELYLMQLNYDCYLLK